MKFEIKHRHTGEVLYSAEIDCAPDAQSSWKLRLVVLKAVKAKASLEDANLCWADLRGADLGGADLSGAYLRRANLGGADLRGADLRDADLDGAGLRKADLGGADLCGANLRGADLRGTNLREADLRGAYLRGADLDFPTASPEQAATRIAAVARAALEADALNMRTWHTCETTHCIAGWAVHLAGDEGKALEAKYDTHLAGLSLLGHEAAAHFYDDHEDATAWLRAKLDA